MPEKRYQRPRSCLFCTEKGMFADYKDPANLSKFISPFGKIMPRRRTRVCAKHQRKMTQAIKRARYLALLPYQVK